MDTQYVEVQKIISNKKIRDFVSKNLRQTLPDIGFSNEFIEYLLTNLHDLDFEEMFETYSPELHRVFTQGFLQDIFPTYLEKQVVPHIPPSDTILDLGCGTGILAKKLAERREFKKIIGIDINTYPQWEGIASDKVEFFVVPTDEFHTFMRELSPDNVVITVTLHHMPFKDQETYLQEVYEALKPGSVLIILEDSYAEEMPPDFGPEKYAAFMEWGKIERAQIMSVYDWIANRVLAQREIVPIPFTYRTLEEWESLCDEIGFATIKKTFIGFPEKRDINTPQSVLVVKKQ